MYPEVLVTPMKEELTEYGFIDMQTPEEVETQLSQPGTTLVVVNSVCGCSAGTARPGVLMAVVNATKKPDNLSTSFAGFDIEAVKTLSPAFIAFRHLHHLLAYLRMVNSFTLSKDIRLKVVPPR